MNLFIPQWQGSGTSKELFEGAYALKNYIEKRFECKFVKIDVDTGNLLEIKKNILGYDQIKSQLLKLHEVIEEHQPETIFTVGGGCGVEIPIVSYMNGIYSELSVFWFDAHGDLNSPESSVSKHFHGMPLRFLSDPFVIFDGLNISKVSPGNISLIGTRDLDESEESYIISNRMSVISVEDIQSKKISLARFGENRTEAYIHIDLDVLDPAYYRNVKCPTKNGLSIEELHEVIEIIENNFNVVGLSLVENTEISDKEMTRLDRIINFFT